MQAQNNILNLKLIFVFILLIFLIIVVEFFEKSWIEYILQSERLKNYLVGYGILGAIINSFVKLKTTKIEFNFSFFIESVINVVTYYAVISSSFTLVKAACFQLLGKQDYFTHIQGIDLGVIAIVSGALLVKFLVDVTKHLIDFIQLKSSADVSAVPDEA